MDLIYLSISVGFLGVMAFLAVICDKMSSKIRYLEAIREDVSYIALMIESELKRKDEK